MRGLEPAPALPGPLGLPRASCSSPPAAPVATLLGPPFSSENPHAPAQVWALLRSGAFWKEEPWACLCQGRFPLSSV